MKVLNFMEKVKEILEERFTAVHLADSCMEEIEDQYIFYFQPFNPELITKLFAGWIREIWNSQACYINGIYHIEYSENEKNNNDCHYVYYVGDILTFTTIRPQTLGDFIRDCQRAGIELEWRKK